IRDKEDADQSHHSSLSMFVVVICRRSPSKKQFPPAPRDSFVYGRSEKEQTLRILFSRFEYSFPQYLRDLHPYYVVRNSFRFLFLVLNVLLLPGDQHENKPTLHHHPAPYHRRLQVLLAWCHKYV